MNWSEIEQLLGEGVTLATKLASCASGSSTIASAVAGVIEGFSNLAQTAVTDAQAEGAVISSNDLASIKASQAAIQKLNDDLAAQIAAS